MKKNICLYQYSPAALNPVRRASLAVALITAVACGSAQGNTGAVWLTPIPGGEMLFYDWGYSGPDGRQANDFYSVNGFNGATQIQTVVTQDPDGLTPDDPYYLVQDLTGTDIYGTPSNMDAQVNFYEWGYTTVGGSTFNNMQIDADGDYLIKRQDMSFAFYDVMQHSDLAQPSSTDYTTYDTLIDFQPYALSDATGWCGSVLASNPGSLEAMAGQVTFDFGFEAYFPWSPGSEPGQGSMQIVPDFQMRSYGSLEINMTAADGGSGDFNFSADAVVNNTNPLDSTVELDANGNPVMIEVPVLNMDGTQALDENGDPRYMMVEKKSVGGGGVDENYYNTVSFMGGGVVPEYVWVQVADPNAPMTNDNILEVFYSATGDDIVRDGNGNPVTPDDLTGVNNLVLHQNSFAGYPFLMRADGIRIIDALDYSLYADTSGIPGFALDENGNLINLEGNIVQDLSAIPVPAAVWLFGSGLIGLVGIGRRRRRSH